MPISDPKTGRACVWLVCCVLFVSVAAGGGCLVAYMVIPDTSTAPWLPVVGVTLVCLPWAFWLFTFLYRIISRACGFRVGTVAVGGANATHTSANGVDEAAHMETGMGSPGNDGRGKRETSTRSSVASHESEMPLASSMAQ